MTYYSLFFEARGIQSYIFDSGKMKEMVGASELVKGLCEDKLDTVIDHLGLKRIVPEIKEPIVETIAISICITGLNKEVLAQDIVQIEKGSSAFDALAYTCNKYNMAMSFTGIRLFHH
jgi:hypothetical protein